MGMGQTAGNDQGKPGQKPLKLANEFVKIEISGYTSQVRIEKIRTFQGANVFYVLYGNIGADIKNTDSPVF